jgi:hypothetical protein
VSALFNLVQFEFTHALGPHAGRYLVEDEVRLTTAPDATQPVSRNDQRLVGVTRGLGAADVLVISVVGAPATRIRLKRRPRYLAPAPAAAEVPLMLATFVKVTQPLGDERDAVAALEALRDSPEDQERWVSEGLEVLNRAIRAYRTGARDPYVQEVTARDARRIRLGYGTTDEVRDGAWRAAVELEPPATSWLARREVLRPYETVAGALAQRKPPLEAEDVLLRALIDLDHGRTRAAAQQVRAALALMLAELREAPGSFDLYQLAQRLPLVDEIAMTALERPLEAVELQALEEHIDAVGGLLESWRHGDRDRAG